MNRIDAIFADLRSRPGGGKALMPYLTAGDPDVETTGRLLGVLQAAGASICEVGFPFSDPIADGPVIQASMTHALGRGVRVAEIFEMIAARRAGLRIGLVAMLSISIVHRFGPAAFIREAKHAGIDGFIFPDLPIEEAQSVRDLVAGQGLIVSFLIAPTTPIARAQAIAKASSGFIYMLSRAGITGERGELPAELGQRVAQIKSVTDLPIAVGFGVSTARQVRQVVQLADAAIVGSAIVRRIADARGRGAAAVIAEVERFVRELADGLTPETVKR